MKRLAASALALLLFFTSGLAPSVYAMSLDSSVSHLGNSTDTLTYTYADIKNLPDEPDLDYDFPAASPKWKELVSNEQPASFSVSYELANGVINVDDSTLAGKIADEGQLLSGGTVQKLKPNRIIAGGGYIAKDVLDAAAAIKGGEIKNGSVVVDTNTGTAFKVVSPYRIFWYIRV